MLEIGPRPHSRRKRRKTVSYRSRLQHWFPGLLPLTMVALAGCGTEREAPLAPSEAPLLAKKATRPGAPTGVQATAGDAQATVRWTAPTSTGSSAITSYHVTVSPSGRVITVAAPATSTTVTGLTNGTTYTFYVAATNSAGTGPNSTASNPVTPTAATPTPTPTPTPSTGRWLMGYYVGYQRSLYPETSVDFTYMTHVAVGAIQATSTGGVTKDFYIDNTNGPIMAKNLSARAHSFGRKAILMLGGAGYRNNLVSATSNTYRATFVANLLATMDQLGYDGIDVDWEPVLDSDKPQLLQFLKDLRAARPSMIITFPVMWANTNFPSDVDAWYGQAAAVVDRVNIMSYDMAGNWGGWTSWHGAALYGEGSNHPSSISGSVNAYKAAGVPAAKLGFGVGAYGNCWRGPTTILQSLASGQDVVASDNTMSYVNIMSQYYNSSAYRWDATGHMGYLSFASATGPAGCTLVSYDNPQSLADKGAYGKAQGLGGAIMWTINQQYFPSAAAGQRDPLLQALYTAMVP
jgi:chitinase